MKKTNNLIALFFVLFLVMFFNVSYCEANSNLTLKDFRKLCNIPGDVEVPKDLQTIVTSYNPVIIKSQTGNYSIYPTSNVASTFGTTHGFSGFEFKITGSNENLQYIFTPKFTSTGNWQYINGSNRMSFYNYQYDVTNKTFSKKIFINTCSGYSMTSGTYGLAQEGTYIGFKIDLNSELVDEFKSIIRLKEFLSTNLIFSGIDHIYYGSNDVFYKFDGTIKYYPRIISGDIVKWKTNATVTADDVNLAFNYSPNYDLSAGVLNLYVDLEELTPSEVIKQDDYYGYIGSYTRFFTSDLHNFNYSDLTNYNVKYSDLIKQMKEGYIYRLRFYVEQFNNRTNMVSLYYDISTSCYFSLNDWKSSDYIIKNIYKLFLSASGIEIIPGDSSDKDKDLSIKDLNNNIKNTILGTPNESGEREGGLLGGILDGIKGFFIPSSEFFNNYFNELNNWFSDRLGLLYFPIDFIISFLNRIYSSEFNDVIFDIPDIYIPGYGKDTGCSPIIPAYKFNFTNFVNSNDNIKTIYDMYLLVVDGIIIWGIIQLFSKKYEEVTTK